jgi:hypothetical protein
MGFSFPLGIPFLANPLLLVGIVAGRGHMWVYPLHGIYLGLIGVFLWQAVSRTQWEKVHARVPEVTRANWVLNWMIFFVALPTLLWVFFGLKTLLR